jgi:hypothetical protein
MKNKAKSDRDCFLNNLFDMPEAYFLEMYGNVKLNALDGCKKSQEVFPVYEYARMER